MSGFKTHLYSGVAVSAATSAFFMFKYPSTFTPIQLSGIFLTGTIGGLLPDLDSDTSRPFSMLFTFLSMILPILFFKEIGNIWLYIIPYIEIVFSVVTKCFSSILTILNSYFDLLPNQFNLLPAKLGTFPTFEELTPEFIITYFVFSYILIRYALCGVIKRITIHRGIMHSIPFALLCAEIGFIIFIPSGKIMALAVAISILLGFFTHLVLDEANSITFKHGIVPKLKKSAGTALKFSSRSKFITLLIYLFVVAVGVRVVELMDLLN